MAKLDFAEAKADIAAIVDIVETVPEGLQLRCFELLFEAAFNEHRPSQPEKSASPEENFGNDNGQEKLPEPPSQGKKLAPNVLAFIRRHNVTPEDLGKLFMVDHDPLLPIYKIPNGNMAKAHS